MDNRTIAQHLLDHANYLEAREVNLYRVRAYRKAAEAILALDRRVADILVKEGRAGLETIPGIGSHLSYTLEYLVRTGEFRTLSRAIGHIDPERIFTSLPGVGPSLARRLHDELGITNLEELERAAHEGRLGALGIGPKRLRALIDTLAARLARRPLPEPIVGEPSVVELLEVDQAYRNQARRHLLPTISPRRYNPTNEPWLPLYQTRRGGWKYRALFSNTALAHRLGQTHDWVVIHFTDWIISGQRTVVTETRGDLRGRRVVRGREPECRDHYRADEELTRRDSTAMLSASS